MKKLWKKVISIILFISFIFGQLPGTASIQKVAGQSNRMVSPQDSSDMYPKINDISFSESNDHLEGDTSDSTIETEPVKGDISGSAIEIQPEDKDTPEPLESIIEQAKEKPEVSDNGQNNDETVLEEISAQALPVEPPVADKPSGSYPAGTQVSLSCASEDSGIYYTTDGSPPVGKGMLYESPLVIESDLALKAVSVEESVYSDISEYYYTLDDSNITFIQWYFSDEGKINTSNVEWFSIEGSFSSAMDITCIEYSFSEDGNEWFSVDDDFIRDMIVWDSGLGIYNGQWYRSVEFDLTAMPDCTFLVRATATDMDGGSLTVETQLYKDTTPPADATDLSVEPNAENNGLVLTWTNPADDFEYALVYRLDDYYAFSEDGYDGYWTELDETTGSSYTDYYVEPYETYTYKVVVVDPAGNRSEDPVEISGELKREPLYFVDWYMNDIINSWNHQSFGVEARFIAEEEVVSIEYHWSADGLAWEEIDALISSDYGLEYYDWDNEWCRYVLLDLSSFDDGNYWLKATATDAIGNTLIETFPLLKDTVVPDATDLTVTPNEANDALVLTWNNPDDFDYARIYKYTYSYYGGWQWRSIAYVYSNTYTDTDVDPANPYISYSYRVVIYDIHGNESENPPEVTGKLYTEGLMGFSRWDIENEGKITCNNVKGSDINAYFLSSNPIISIDYNYKTTGDEWKSFTPYITNDYGGVFYYAESATGNRHIVVNISGPLGIPDGEIVLQAVATDEEGNTYAAELLLAKDTIPPESVTGFTVTPNDDQTGLVLSWNNPLEDFSHVIIERGTRTLDYEFVGDYYLDTTALAGTTYRYSITTVDAFGNRDVNPPEVTAVLPTLDGPVLESMWPEDGLLTNAASIGYEANFRCEEEVVSILFEVSPDGTVWHSLNLYETLPSMASGFYKKTGTWDIKAIGEEDYFIRATATDARGRTTTVTRTVCIDHIGPAAPADFTATVGTTAPYSVSLSWSPGEEIDRYYLRRYPANPDEDSNKGWNIYPPEHSYIDTSSVKESVTYIYSLQAVDTAGNMGEPATLIKEIYNGPILSLDGGLDFYTNESEYTLHGLTEPGSVVTIDGNEVSVDEDGGFLYSTTLQEGKQTFTVTASYEGLSHTQKQRVFLDTKPPTVGSISPADNTVIGGRNRHASFSTSDIGSGIEKRIMQVSRDDGATWEDVYDFTDEASFYWDTTLPVGAAGPLSDGPYKFRALVWDRAGNDSGDTQVRVWIVDNTPPAPPRNLAASGGEDLINLSWLANTEPDLHSTPYRIYRSTTPGAGYTYIASTDKTGFADTTIKNDTAYYYVVTARDNILNESEFSQEVSSQPQKDTIPPVITYIPVSDGQVKGGATINFKPRATDNSPQGVDRFLFEYSADAGETWEATGYQARLYSYQTTSYYYCDIAWNTEGLESGAYILRFTAVDYAGNTASETKNIILDLDVSKPQHLTATPGEGSVILNWEPVADEDFYWYDVYRSTYITNGYQQIGSSILDRENTTYTDTDVQLNKTYYYKVTHRDKSGNIAESDVVSGMPTDDLTLPVVTEISPADGADKGGPTISFNATATDNKAVSRMNGFYSLDDGATWEDMNHLKNNYPNGNRLTTYFTWYTSELPKAEEINAMIKVVAQDAAGNEGSLVVSWKLDLLVNPVSNLRTTPGDGSILLEWDPSPDDDISFYQTYRILRSTQSGGPYYDIGPGGNPVYTSSTQYTDTGLLPNTIYYYVVETQDSFYNKARSEEVAGKVAVDDIPPYIVKVSPENGMTIGGDYDRYLFVYFQDNSGPAGATAKIEYKDQEGNWVPVNDYISNPIKEQGSDNYQFNAAWDLGPIDTGNYTVRYSVYDGSGNLSEQEVTYLVDRTAPAPPRNLVAIYGLGSIGLAWEAPSDADVDCYRIYRANTLEGPFNLLDQVDGRENIFYSDNTVQSGLTYFYQVSAVDKFQQEGLLSNMAAVAAQEDNVPPNVIGIEPEDFTVLGPQASITVRAEDNVFLSSITLEYSTDNGENWFEITTIATREVAVFAWDPSPLNGEVQIRALARDSSNNVSDGSPVRTYTVDTTGPNVTGLTYTAYPTEILFRWDDVPDDDFHYFQVECRSENYLYSTKIYNTLGIMLDKLVPDREYWFQVTAYDRSGNPGLSAEVYATTLGDILAPWFSAPPLHSQFNYGSQLKIVQDVNDNVGVAALTFQYSSDNYTWKEITTETFSSMPKYKRHYYDWDIAELTEGSYFVRAIATDKAGNESSPSQVLEYIIDRTPPAKLTGLTASATSGYVELTWNKPEDDGAEFCIYRSLAEDGPYTKLADNVKYLNYRDRAVKMEDTYYYKVTVLDASGNESEVAGPVSASLTPDTSPPSIVNMIPQLNKDLGAKTQFSVLAQDDLYISSIALEYKIEDAGDDQWSPIGVENIVGDCYYRIAKIDWDATGLPSGKYLVRAIATDRGGNISEPFIVGYTLHTDSPSPPDVTALADGWRVDLSWTGEEDPAVAGYRVYRSTLQGGPYSLIKTTAKDSFGDFPLVPGQRYYYYVEAVDSYGNVGKSEVVNAVPTTDDPYPPTADAGDDLVVTVGMEASFDGSYSSDNDRIASYFWDFGDGNTATIAQPNHAYDSIGTYTVHLTVTDPTGNSAADSCQVEVVSPEEVGVLEVRVVDDVSGLPLPGASIVIQYPDGATQKSTSNSLGLANVVAPPGEYKIYAYINDYRPAAINATMVRNQRTSTSVRLKRGQLVLGELNVKRMDLDEIIAAGVDITAPENQNVFKFELHLGFNKQEIILNGWGNQPGMDTGGVGEGVRIPPFLTEYEDEVVEVQPIAIPHPGRPEIPPAMAYLVIPGEARWLKEFFNVGLIIENAADPEFVIAEAIAHLKLPDGLALAPTRIPQHVQVDLESIPGGEKREVQWIIRGDKKGEYHLSAEFEGILQPFGDAVKKIFRTQQPLRVWGEDALQMQVIAQDQTEIGYPYNLTMGIENVSDTSVYNLSLELLDEGKQNYIYAPNQVLVKSVRELLPGETLWQDYQLIPSIEGELSLEQSYVLQTGGNVNVKTNITSQSVPENSKGTAPVLTQENSAGEVHLSWDPVEDALGYSLYYVRDDLFISMEPEIVYSGGPGVTEITLDEPDGPRDYVLKTITATGEILCHAMTGLSWIDKAGAPVITIYPEEVPVGRDTELLITVNKGGFPVAGGIVDVGDLEMGCILDGNGQARVVIRPEEPGPITVAVYQSEQLLVSKTIVAVEPEPPAKPMGVKARDEVGKVNLSWFANSEPDLAGYDVYQLIDNTWQKVNAELITETSYLVTALHFNTSYIFQICAVNDRGISSPYSDPVEILLGPDPDSVAPWVISTTPVNNQTGVAVNTMIAVNFSENISLDIEYHHIEVKVNSKSVEYEIEVNGNSLILILKDLLPYTSLCEVFIPAGAIREFGAWNQLEEDFAFKFFTGVEPDARPPQVVAIAPGDNEKDVPVNTEISISFNEDIVLGPNHQDILLTTSGQSLSFTTEVNRNVLTLKPAGSLPYSAFCEVSIPLGAISDIAGNQLANSYSFRFFTGVAPDEAPPAIIAIVPADNSKDVPLNAEINLYFSEDLAQGAYFENIELYAGEEVLEYIWSINGSILTLKPIEELPKTMGCNVFIPSEAVQDTAGNQLEKDREFRFYTGLVPDFNAPIIQSIEPLKNYDGLQTEKKTVRFAFNEIVQQSLDVCSIALNLNGEPINFTTEILGNDLTLTTEKEMLEGDYLEVTIPAEAIKDVSGNHLEEEYLFTFTKEPPSKNWEKVFGGAGADEAYAVVQTEDGGFVFTGYYTESDGQEYVYLVKVDASGEQVWERKFGGGFHDVGRDIDQTSDGGFIITGISRATMQSNERINLIKTDSDGYAQWEHELDLEEQGYLSARRQAYASTQTKDGGYLVVGGIIQAEKSDPFLLKTDSLGQVVWIKLFPGTGWGCFYAVEETEDESVILAGYTEIDAKRQSIIIKTDSQGNQVWLYDFKTVDQGQARAVQETKDGGYIVTGYMGAKLYLLKLSGDGKQQWQRALGGSFGYSVSATKDDGYIAAGSGSKGVYVVKTDKTGKMEWEKDFGEAGDVAYSIRQTEDECYIVAGAKNKNGTDAYLIKFEPERKVFLGVSSPNVFEEGMVLVYATIVDGSGKLDTSGKVKVKVKVTGFDDDLELNDAGSEGDFQAKDGVYSKWLKLAGPETVKIELYVDDNDAKKSVEVKVIDEMPLPVVVMTDFEALYKEFRNTGMSPEVDSNKNKIPDYYDLLDRLNKYADNHNGIVVDLQKEITADNSYSPDYSALQYEDNVAIKRYQGPIMIDETTTLKYIAKDQYNNWSKMASETYTIDESAEIVPTVVAFPKGGKFREAQNVTLVASDPAAEIYYTTDGSDPNEESARYDEPLYISKTTTLKFMAKLADKQSKILKEDYNIDTIWGPRVPAVSAIPGGGTYNEKLWVTLRGTDGAEIYYTTDGSALVADRKKMGELISEYMKRLGHATAFKNLAIIGDDSVVPFYRLESPSPAMNEQKYANSPRDYGNPTLIDTGKDLVMTDIPYAIYGNTDTPENIKKPVIDAGVGRVFATRPANLIKMIDQYEKPITLIPYDRNAAIFSLEDETLDPQNKSAINWPSAVKTALIPVMDKAFSGKGRTAKPISYERGKYYYYDGSSMDWKAEDVTAAVAKTNITLLWDHATHKDANTKNNAKLVPKDFDKMTDSPGHILISNGSHMGYSVSQYSSEADYTPYKTAFVRSILEKKVTYIAPTTYGVGAEPALAYHDLLLQRFLDNLLTTTSSNQATVGEAQIAAYQDYWALTAPKYVDNTSTYATFGTALYGLPTQPVHQQVETKMLNMAPLKANMEIGATNPGVLKIEDVNDEVNIFSIEQIQDTNAFTISMDVPHFNISQHPGGKTSFAVPNSGTFLINAYAPRLPLVTKSYLLPKGSVVNDVTLANETTSIYQDVDLMEFTPVHRTFGSLEGSIEIPDPYPEEIFWWSTDEENGGTRLSVGIIPLQYNSATRTVTLYNHLELSVDHTASSSGTSIDFVNVNYDRPLEADIEDVPIEVRVSSSVRQNVTLRWTIKDPMGLTLESGREDLELIAGSNVIPFNIDTVGWKPEYKNLTISLSAPDILDTTNIEVLVYGLNLEAMLSQGTYLPTEDVGVMAVSIYDETGTPVTGLELGNFIFDIDGQPLSGATVTENEAGKYSFEFPLSGLAEDIHYINFTCQDKRGYQTSESIQFAVATDSTPPLIMETYPEANMAGVDTGVVISVTFNEKIEEGPFYENIVLENEDAVVPFNPAIDGKILTLTPHDELAKGTVYNLIIPAGAIQDLAKNEFEFEHSFKFITWSEVDITPPVLVSTEPVEGTNNVPATARASFTFSETIKQSDNLDGITWVTEDENAINFNPILNGEQLILVPLHALPCGTKSLITIPEGAVSDQVGNNLESDLSLSFTIEDGPDLKSPEIMQIIPCANCTGVLTDALVTIRFDKPVFPGENYQWMTWQTDSKAVTFISDIKGDTLTMTPVEPLLNGTVFTVTLPAGTVTDLAGNDLLSGAEFSFTTGYARDTIPPKVEGTIPAHQGEGVLPDAAAYIYFDEAIQESDHFNEITWRIGSTDGGGINFNAQINGRIIILTPQGGLNYDTVYTVDIPVNAVKDLEGNQLADNCTVSFTTGGMLDTIAPEVSLIEPAKDNVAVNTVIKIYFNDYIKQGSSINDIKILDDHNDEIQYTPVISETIFTLTPVSYLNLATTYTVILPVGAVMDLAGNESGEIIYQFTTAADPTVVSTYDFSYLVPDEIVAGTEIAVLVTFAAVDEGDIGYEGVRFKFVAEGPGDVTFKAVDSNDVEHTFINEGYWGPAEGFDLPATYTATTDWTLVFSEAGDYTITFSLIDAISEEVIADITDMVTVEVTEPLTYSNYQMSIEGPETLELGETGEYAVRAFGDGSGNTSYIAIYNYALTGGVGTLEYKDGEEWKEISLTGQFGPSGGFELSPDWDATTAFRFTPDEVGTYVVEVNLTEAGGAGAKLAEVAYIIEVAEALTLTVSAAPAGGNYSGPQSITLTASEPGAEIYFTTDGSDPDEESNKYKEPIIIDQTTTLKFKAKDSEGNWSEIYTVNYKISKGDGSSQPGRPKEKPSQPELPDMPKELKCPEFPDINGHWAKKEIMYLACQGIVNGYPDGLFRPEKKITRAEFAQILALSVGPQNRNKIVEFSDIKGHWAESVILARDWRGYPDKTFHPESLISRQETASIIVRGMELKPGSLDFLDANNIGEWAKPSVTTLVLCGIINGYPDGTFRPYCDITRAEASVLIYKLLHHEDE